MLDIFAELSGLVLAVCDTNTTLTRIADALDRLAPPVSLPALEHASRAAGSLHPVDGTARDSATFTFAESPEEYQARTSHDAALAISLGIAPWSPDFEKTISQFKSDLMRPSMEVNEEGTIQRREGLSEGEAEDVVRRAFKEARAAQNTR